MPTRTALILLAATACAMTTTALLVLLIAPDMALLAAVVVYLAAGRISRRVWGIGLAVAAAAIWYAATRKNGDPR
ncbi:hypothetical protein PV350_04845 [Streptomyces sp. PA03-6a]|nr:hypothetical protein [Streptomyces sp. PA03-6a]